MTSLQRRRSLVLKARDREDREQRHRRDPRRITEGLERDGDERHQSDGRHRVQGRDQRVDRVVHETPPAGRDADHKTEHEGDREAADQLAKALCHRLLQLAIRDELKERAHDVGRRTQDQLVQRRTEEFPDGQEQPDRSETDRPIAGAKPPPTRPRRGELTGLLDLHADLVVRHAITNCSRRRRQQ